MRCLLLTFVLLAVNASLPHLCEAAGPSDFDKQIACIRAIGTNGSGHREAIAAYRELAQTPANRIPAILAGFEGAGALAQNWLRAAVDTIAERQLKTGGVLPAAQLEAFIRRTDNPPRARGLAYEWLLHVDPSARNRLLPDLLDDASSELRRAAVAFAVEQADQRDPAQNRPQAIAAFRRALTAARDLDQVNNLAKRLEDLGRPVDLRAHFGFLTDWQVIGPFDNTDRQGYHTVFPPEKRRDPDATYEGPFGNVQWRPYHSSDRLGTVDLNEALGTRKQVTGYAWAQFVSDRERHVELRWSTRNASKLWLNGTLLAENEVYHAGRSFDQYRAQAVLKQGPNEILLKICQNEQTQSWTRYWDFQCRVCDDKGTAILPTNGGELRVP
jgi:hypothetical protein